MATTAGGNTNRVAKQTLTYSGRNQMKMGAVRTKLMLKGLHADHGAGNKLAMVGGDKDKRQQKRRARRMTTATI